MMQICKRCLYTAYHPLNIVFDEEGICSGCRVHEEKDRIDWDAKGCKLAEIFEDYRNKSGKNYDCVIPVTGAQDSYYIVHIVKNIYRMNPLLVTYNKHYNTAVGIRNLANLRIQFNCDIMTMTVNPETVKKITRFTLRKFGSMYWHCLAGQTVYPVQIAAKFKIPLIVWGVHQGVDQVGMFSHLDEVEMSRKYRKEHDLMGFEAEDLIDELDNITEADVLPFSYPDNRELEQVGVRGIYLNNYMRWDSRAQHERMIREYGYQTASQTRTFDTYNNVECWNYSDVHDYLKWLKHGYGKVLDHACREIRLGRMTRSQGIELVGEFQSRRPQHLQLFLDWLGISKNAFHYIVDQHRNLRIWKRDKNWNWKLRKPLSHVYKDNSILRHEYAFVEPHSDYIITGAIKSDDLSDQYILFGRGWA